MGKDLWKAQSCHLDCLAEVIFLEKLSEEVTLLRLATSLNMWIAYMFILFSTVSLAPCLTYFGFLISILEMNE